MSDKGVEIREDKYVVIKRADLVEWMNECKIDVPQGLLLNSIMLANTVVIRLQDVFAPPVLHEYASHIQTLLEFSDELGVFRDPEAETELDEKRAFLEALRDYFKDMAERSENMERKFPDN